jgi:hypothetical protein
LFIHFLPKDLLLDGDQCTGMLWRNYGDGVEGVWRLEIGDWRLENREWRIENGERRMESGEWRGERGEGRGEKGEWRLEIEGRGMRGGDGDRFLLSAPQNICS